VMYRHVFAPLVQRATAVNLSQESQRSHTDSVESSSTPPAAPPCENGSDDGHDGVSSVENRNRYHESVVSFSHYLLNCILEYGRSLVQNGETLSDATQRCILNLFLQQPSSSTVSSQLQHVHAQDDISREDPPDYFRLHQLLMFRAIDDRVSTALQLVSLESKYPPAFQMGLDMLSRLNAITDIVNVYIAKQQPLVAAKHIVASGWMASGETGISSVKSNSPRQHRNNALDDVLFCSAFLHDEERRQMGLAPFTFPVLSSPASPKSSASSKGGKIPRRESEKEMTKAGSQFYTTYAILASHFPTVLSNTSSNPVYATHKARFIALSEGTCC